MKKMKKMSRWFVVAAMIAMPKMIPSGAFAADSVTVDVLMTIQTLSLSVVGSTSTTNFGVLGSTKVTNRYIIKNDGNGPENFQVRVSNVANWALVSGVPGDNQVRLSGIWHEWNINPSASEFQSNDILTTTNQTSSDTVFFNDTETHATDGVKGYDVAANAERNMFVRIEFPETGSGSGMATLTFTAIAP